MDLAPGQDSVMPFSEKDSKIVNSIKGGESLG
jgi:hypothetical protein